MVSVNSLPMKWLQEWLPSVSFENVRARNFERCVEQGAGTRIIDRKSTATGQRVTVRLAPDSSINQDLLQLINTSSVEMTGISTEEGSTYLKVEID